MGLVFSRIWPIAKLYGACGRIMHDLTEVLCIDSHFRLVPFAPGLQVQRRDEKENWISYSILSLSDLQTNGVSSALFLVVELSQQQATTTTRSTPGTGICYCTRHIYYYRDWIKSLIALWGACLCVCSLCVYVCVWERCIHTAFEFSEQRIIPKGIDDWWIMLWYSYYTKYVVCSHENIIIFFCHDFQDSSGLNVCVLNVACSLENDFDYANKFKFDSKVENIFAQQRIAKALKAPSPMLIHANSILFIFSTTRIWKQKWRPFNQWFFQRFPSICNAVNGISFDGRTNEVSLKSFKSNLLNASERIDVAWRTRECNWILTNGTDFVISFYSRSFSEHRDSPEPFKLNVVYWIVYDVSNEQTAPQITLEWYESQSTILYNKQSYTYIWIPKNSEWRRLIFK